MKKAVITLTVVLTLAFTALVVVVSAVIAPSANTCVPGAGAVQALPAGERPGELDDAQLDVAQAIIEATDQVPGLAGLDSASVEQARRIALAVAAQESRFRILANDGKGGDLASDQAGIERSLEFPNDGVGSEHGSLGYMQQQWPWWGTMAQLMDRTAPAVLFYERLLTVKDWSTLPVTEAAQAVQRSAFPTAYADEVDLADQLLAFFARPASEQRTAPGASTVERAALQTEDDTTIRVVSANIKSGMPDAAYSADLRQAVTLGADFIGLQEANQKPRPLITPEGYDSYRSEENPYVKETPVLWRTDRWTAIGAGSRMTSQNDLHWGARGVNWVTVQSTGPGGQVVSFVSVHQLTHGWPSQPDRYAEYGEGMAVLQALVGELATHGAVVLVGDFNIHYAEDLRELHPLWPRTMFAQVGVATAFDALGVVATGDQGATIDYVWYLQGNGLTPVRQGSLPMNSDHQMLWTDFALGATTGTSSTVPIGTLPTSGGSCANAVALTGGTTCPATGLEAEQGLSPDALRVLRCVDQAFGRHGYAGVGERASNPHSDHPNGLAVDVMIAEWESTAGIAEGNAIAAWVREHAEELGVKYVIWRAQIWNVGDDDWSAYSHPSGATDANSRHMNHVHVSVVGNAGTGFAQQITGGVAFPLPPNSGYVDNANWGDTGSYWTRWHTGNDYSVACGTPVYAVHTGTVEIDRNASWSGPALVKVGQGPSRLTTWYGHMESVSVSAGQVVQPGTQLGTVGAEGNSNGCHLHLEVHTAGGDMYGEDNTDPATWLAQQLGEAAA